MNIFSQEQTFILFTIIGILLGLMFDFFRSIRKVFKTSNNITFLEDLIFLILSRNNNYLGNNKN